MQRSGHLLLATALLGVPAAHAQAPAPAALPARPDEVARRDPVPRPEAAPRSGAAPHPDVVSGIARPEAAPPAHALFWIPRALLFVPRWAFWAAMQPARLGVWAYERYRGGSLGGDPSGGGGSGGGGRPYGLYPVVTLDTVYGLTAGARTVHRDLAGRGERLELRVDHGGRYAPALGAALHSGGRLGPRVTAGLDARFERRPAARFFGIGDAGVRPAAEDRLDPASGGAAVEASYGERLARAAGTGAVRIAGPWAAGASVALASRSFTGGRGGDLPGVPAAYDTSRLAGWDRGADALHVEGALVHDSRRPSSPYQTRAIDATGGYAAARLGGARGVAGDPTAYVRYGAEALWLLDLYRGSRVVALGVLVESIAGSGGRAGGTIAFAELPALGGERLRGYPEGRFRDRARVLGTAEYTWDLGNFLAAYLFVDAGRVLPSLAELSPGARLRAGYGGGLEAHTRVGFVGRAQLAASRDGDLLLEIVLAPGAGRARPGRW
jgi:hypothetical protein